MAKFTTRVVLHGAAPNDYDDLHKEMEKRGFQRTIRGPDGVEYALPDAEYDFEGDIPRKQVHQNAVAAAKAAMPARKNSVLVTESSGRVWSNLDPVD